MCLLVDFEGSETLLVKSPSAWSLYLRMLIQMRLESGLFHVLVDTLIESSFGETWTRNLLLVGLTERSWANCFLWQFHAPQSERLA